MCFEHNRRGSRGMGSRAVSERQIAALEQTLKQEHPGRVGWISITAQMYFRVK